jgi:succinoglycan biosynthesis transport protein ExoP
VISLAASPSQKSKPNNSLALAIAATMGLILSLGAASLREAIDRVFRTARQVEQSLRVKCLSVIPLVRAQATPGAVQPRLRAAAARGPSPGDVAAATAPSFTLTDPMMHRVLDDPLSVFTESFRTIKVAAGLRAAVRGEKVIGITSTLPNEGKSTVACNLAVLMADAGKRVILVDADLRNPTLGRCLDRKPTTGLMELLSGTINLAQATGREPATGLAFLPLVLNEQIAHADEVLASQAFRDLIGQLREQFDHVIIDLPPIAPVADVRAAVPIIDSFVFVIEWGGTRINAVQRHLMAEQDLPDKLLGVVLNKADLKVMESFEQQGLYHVGYYANRGYRQ